MQKHPLKLWPAIRISKEPTARLKSILAVTVFSTLMSGCAASTGPVETGKASSLATQRPNILLVVADDLGYSDIGAFGGEISTPNLDRLAATGRMLTNMHVAPTCSPTRAMLLTGIDAHRVGLGTMAEVPMAVRPPGYEGHLLPNAATVAERLKQANYATYMSGKWHLGKQPTQWPASRGFDKSFALLDGGHNHFGMDQTEVWDKTVLTATYVKDHQRARYPEGEFSSDVFANQMIDYIRSTPKEQPFFGYLAFTAPHWPLQAPAEEIARYKGKYDGGPVRLRAARISRMKSLGLTDEEVSTSPMVDDRAWESLSDEDRAREARAMEIYAAMVHRLDTAIGRVLETLKAQGRLNNTLIVFMSDNGPDSSTNSGAMQISGIADPAAFGIDNQFGSMGTAKSFIGYGPGWAQASAGTLNLFKGYTTEGGTRVPAIVNGPGIASGRSGALLHATDILPTLLDYAQVSSHSTNAHHSELLAPTGYSMRQVLSGSAKQVRSGESSLGYEFFGGAALWRGDWKLLRLPVRSPFALYGTPQSEWRLYNLAQDQGETRNVAALHPDILAQMLKDWADYVVSNNVIEAKAPTAKTP